MKFTKKKIKQTKQNKKKNKKKPHTQFFLIFFTKADHY